MQIYAKRDQGDFFPMHLPTAPTDVACPECQAQPLVPCRWKLGEGELHARSHTPRVDFLYDCQGLVNKWNRWWLRLVD